MALNRINADSIADGTVVASDIADGTITAAKFATLSANVVSTANFNAANFIATNDVIAGTQDGPLLGGATNPIISAIGNNTNYIQNYIINYSNTANASADYVAYPNNGSDANGWIDMGITSNTFNQAAYNITGRNEGYLFMSAPTGSNTSGNLVLGTDSTGTNNAIEFYTGGFGQGKTLPKMRIANNGVTIANLIVTGAASQSLVTLTDGATITANLAQTNNFVVTLGGNRTLANATNITAGSSGFVVVRQDGTGSRTLAFGTGWRFPGNTAPTLTTTASAVDLIVFTARDSGNLVAQAILNVT
jgi:hypothetical protein